MKIIFTILKKNYVLVSLLLVTLFYSCSDETRDIANQEEGVNQELLDAVNQFAGSSSETYRITNALLTNQEAENVDVTGLFNVKDDEFVFSTEGNGDLNVAWHEGFGFNASGVDAATVMSDTRASSKFESLSFNDENLTFTASGFTFSLVDGLIIGTLTLEGGASLAIELTQKTPQDYLQAPASLDTITELFSTTNASVWSGFKGSISQDALFLTNYNSPIDQRDVSAFRFDLSTNVVSNFTYNQEDHPWINLEIINDRIYNVGGSFYQEFNFNFDSLLGNDEITNSMWDFGSAAQDDEIYLFCGSLTSSSLNEVGKYSIDNGNVNIIGSLPSKKNLGDGEIINNKLYIFGGNFIDFAPTYDDFIFDLSTGETEIMTTSIRLGFTSTSVVENLIYVGGMTSEDFNNDGVGDSFDPYLKVFNTLSNTSTEIALNFDLLENERLDKLWATEDFIYLVLTHNANGGAAFNLRVVRAPLN